MGSATEKVEAHLLGKEIPTASVKQFMALIIRSLRINFRNLGKELLYVIPLIFLSFYTSNWYCICHPYIFNSGVLCGFWKYGFYIRASLYI